MSVAGSDWTEWRIRDLDSGQDLPDVLRYTKYYPPAFTPDGKGLYYSAFPAPRAGRGAQHSGSGQRPLLPRARQRPGRAIGGCSAMPPIPTGSTSRSSTGDGRWLVVLAGEGEVGDKARENVYLFDLAVPEHAAPSPSRPVSRPPSSIIGADAGRLFFLTSLDAPRRGACWRSIRSTPSAATGAR